MSGRAAARIFRGPSSRAIAHAVQEAIARQAAPAQAVAACSQCGGPLTFDRAPLSGHTVERCGQCGRSAPVVRVAAEALGELDILLGEHPRRCARCGVELPAGKVGTRRARYCRDRVACIKASEGRTETPALPKLADAVVLEKLPTQRAAARRLQDVAAEFEDFSTEQVRRVLVRLVHRGQVRTTVTPQPRPQGGRAPRRYWRAA